MKKIFFYLFLLNANILLAQTENDPCSAPCLLGASGKFTGQTPPADGNSPNTHLPCGSGTNEDNPTWYTFDAGKTTFKLKGTVGTCSSGSKIEVTVFGGTDCQSITPIACMTVSTSDSITFPTIIGKEYWIQVDGFNESVCNFTFTYDPNSLFKDPPPPIVAGQDSICKGTTHNYSAMLPNGVANSGFAWNIVPASAGTIIGQGKPNPQIKWSQTGTFQLCATPKFDLKCPVVGIQKTCKTIKVKELKEVVSQVTICAEQTPYDLPMLPYIKSVNPSVEGTPDPAIFVVIGPSGTTKTTTINYLMDTSGCSGKVKLTAVVKARGTVYLAPKLIGETDSIKIGANTYTCMDASGSSSVQNYTIQSTNKPQVCDTTYSFLLQCVKINPIIQASSPTIDCINNQQVTLDASKSAFLPMSSAANPGMKTFSWNTGEKTASISVSKSGIYNVTITYDYTLNTAQGIANKKVTKVHSFNLKTKSVSEKIAVVVNTSKTVDLKSIILKNNPTFVGTVSPATFVVNEPKVGISTKKIKVKVIETGCEIDLLLTVWAVKKVNFKEDNPVSFKTTSDDDFSFDEKNVRLYPNPSDGIFNLDFFQEEKENYEWQVFDLQGRLILKDKNTQRIDLQNVSNGIYYLKVFGRNWNTTFKMVKQ